MTRVYRLVVTYPDGSHDADGVPVPGWQPVDGWMPRPHPQEGFGEGPEPFSWPKVHLYLSQRGAALRADLLRSYGAAVEIQVSKPVEWDGAS
jgi:hypothetical protein